MITIDKETGWLLEHFDILEFTYLPSHQFCIDACCSQRVNCYFNCGYWGECHMSDTRGFSNNFSENIRLNAFPNPLRLGQALTINTENIVSLEIYNASSVLVYSGLSEEETTIIPGKVFTQTGIHVLRVKNKYGQVLVHKILVI